MNRTSASWLASVVFIFAVAAVPAHGQITVDDYQRAAGLRAKYQSLALNIIDASGWIPGTTRFWYHKSVRGGFEFDVVDAEKLTKAVAFDHARVAEALSAASGEKVEGNNLPLTDLRFVEAEKGVEFVFKDSRYLCDLTSYTCKKLDQREPRRQRWDMWERGPAPQALSDSAKTSPDGRWEAYIREYNVYIRSKGKKDDSALSQDGSEGNYYTFQSLSWSPDSRKLAVYRLLRGYHRILHYVESSPTDQLQPKHHTMEYAKPGDVLDVDQPVLFLVHERKRIDVDNSLFPNPYELTDLAWRKDGRAFTFEYNQRGHQVYRVIEVDATSGMTRALVSEEPKTFFYYLPARTSARGDGGRKFRFDIQDGREMIWMSERDGWNHLYLLDGVTGKVKNQITRGNWVVRGVDKVDEGKRQIWFRASGMYPEKDPYFVYCYRINFDGTGLITVTDGDGNHSVLYSPDMKYCVDTWSRVDLPPVSELRSTPDQRVLMTVEKADIQELVKGGWQPPEVLVSKARDGKTDIWGVIYRPTNFDPKKKYPVVEYIYAGPHSSFVPKSFQAYNSMQSLAELGFIVSQVDGMGTSNRSKAFHDICWKNLGDAGFPDRILWHKAVAAKYPWYDISRLGIYGNSAGGQNALGALLFYPDFYKVAVSSCGCHDNRMDKIWWNELWMSWPLGPHYAASSNVTNAYRLKGKLFLILGELDTNVDPSSTMQVVNALIKANKTFDLLVIPGGGHGMGGSYGERKMNDFFVRNLLGLEPPNWNQVEPGQ